MASCCVVRVSGLRIKPFGEFRDLARGGVEAGVGKTCLAEEFPGYARSHGVCVLSGRCTCGIPALPWSRSWER